MFEWAFKHLYNVDIWLLNTSDIINDIDLLQIFLFTIESINVFLKWNIIDFQTIDHYDKRFRK